MNNNENISEQFNTIVNGLRPYISNGATITTHGTTVIINGNLEIIDKKAPTLPRYLHVTGDCTIENAKLRNSHLPDVLVVDGTLSLENNENLSRLPKILHVNGDIKLQETNIWQLQNDFEYHGTGAAIFLPNGVNCFTAEQARDIIMQHEHKIMEDNIDTTLANYPHKLAAA